mmetsp:Transcript_13454/g.22930  ORF Transcript_13454/g.22930 Transcript_13454/m.22930 type:complete len:89 (-) Transcript_13454:316-582(-)|eukprot:CAMPEP_0183725442 /NCGR_PEP_ID=MMETSP0737-20130205/20676_1 /TAXON_ID=385413 /ORGANISM="Thalassiosira miniscula, Strain CCMP1093" /LENGTH=88 /DNA_ID=CAMNT_0025956439 /DNA_START=339 /DNA_END=605 /DNA_ORIENTATION=+
MDYQGQKLSENLFYYIIILFGSIGWIYGYFLQDFTYVFYSWSVGVAISIVLCVPDWPIYNRHPIKWLDDIPDRDSDSEEEEEETKKTK